MAIDVFGEELVTMSQAAKRLPRLKGARPVAPSTIWRWVSTGLKADDGQNVRLETVRIGGTRCTSIEALRRFFNRLQEQPAPAYGDESAPGNRQPGWRFEERSKPNSTPERKKQMEDAARSLDFWSIGCERLLHESGYSEQTLLSIFDSLRTKLPDSNIGNGRAYGAIRRAVYLHAVEILQGKFGRPQGLAAAKAWIDGLDLKTLDVRSLKGIGDHFESEWNALLASGGLHHLLEST